MNDLIRASYNSDLIGEDESRNFGVEIGQGSTDFEWFANITDYEFFATEQEAKDRATEINNLLTNDWSEL